ncbi:MAG: flavodoxin family protein [Lentisphaerales bacterium]|jgi:NAD(P)H dehydrogenase (quinone)|nr:MAG: flavodoxin family protein [Lentisphaerales bacterium]
MAKVLIVYYSRSGNTEQMAKLVAEGVKEGGASVEVKAVADTSLDDLKSADGIVLGSPTYYGSMSAEIKRLLDDSVKLHGKLVGKVGGAFSSAANLGGGNETTIMDMLKALLIHGMIVPGNVKGDHYGPVAINAPDERSAAQCHRMGRIIGELAVRLHQ